MANNSGVYLICFDKLFGTPDKRADFQPRVRHYLGYADDLDRRIAEHKAGAGSHLTRAAVKAGIELRVAQVWPGADRSFERALKNQKNAKRFCPLCGCESRSALIYLPVDDATNARGESLGASEGQLKVIEAIQRELAKSYEANIVAMRFQRLAYQIGVRRATIEVENTLVKELGL